MIADVVHPLTGNGVFDVEPYFLVEQEQGQIVEEWSLVLRAQFIISASCDEQRTISGYVAHGMAKSRSRRLTRGFDGGELSMHDLSVDDDRFEVAQLVLQVTFLVLTSKEVDAFLDRIALEVFK